MVDGNGVRGGEWEKSGSIEAKRHRVSWSMSITIMTCIEAKQQQREKQKPGAEGQAGSQAKTRG